MMRRYRGKGKGWIVEEFFNGGHPWQFTCRNSLRGGETTFYGDSTQRL